ncbi:MAG: hypothetical protein Aurels2KO_19000 [Aureliella sp.]
MLATFAVNSTGDLLNLSDATETLRDAIERSNLNGAGHDTIDLSAIANTEIDLQAGELPITGSLTILGSGVTIDGQHQNRILNLRGPDYEEFFAGHGQDRVPADGLDLTLDNLKLKRGATTQRNLLDLSLGDDFHSGGAVRFNSTGTLTLTNNSSVRDSFTKGVRARGGGIFSAGDVVLEGGSEVHGNFTGPKPETLSLGGKIGFQLVQVTSLTQTGQAATGGGIFSQGSVSLDGAEVSNNATFGKGSYGGGIAAIERVDLLNQSEVKNNFTNQNLASGGGIHAGGFKYVADPNNPTPLDGLEQFVGYVSVSGNSVVKDNQTFDRGAPGGGIHADIVSINDSVVSDNRTRANSSPGGGIFASGHLELINSTLSNNKTSGGTTAVAQFACTVALEVAKKIVLKKISTTANSTNGSKATQAAKYFEKVKTGFKKVQQVSERFTGQKLFNDLDPCPTASGSGSPGGGAQAGTMKIHGSDILNNATGVVNEDLLIGTFGGAYSWGGGLYSKNGITVTDSNFDGNSTDGSQAGGGAIASGADVIVRNSVFQGNYTGDGDLSGRRSRGGAISSFHTVSIEDSRFFNNSTRSTNYTGEARGGAIYGRKVDLKRSEVLNNYTLGVRSAGGGIFALDTASISYSTIAGNSTHGDTRVNGGDRSSLNGQSGGAGIAAENVVLLNSSVLNNSTLGEDAHGAGVHARGLLTSIYSTIADNTATGLGSDGGGIHAFNAQVFSNTFTGNYAKNQGGGLSVRSELGLHDSLVLGNSAAALLLPGNDIHNQFSDFHKFTSYGTNIVGRPGFESVDTVAPNYNGTTLQSATPGSVFDSLGGVAGIAGRPADNGGFAAGLITNSSITGNAPLRSTIETVKLNVSASNPALDAVTLASSAADQRGFPRAFDYGGTNNGGLSDVGAYEYQSRSLFVTTNLLAEAGKTSLPQAIATANSTPGANTITFASSLSGQTIQLDDELTISDAVHIDASSLENRVFIRGDFSDGGNSDERIFNFTPVTGDLTLTNLALSNGGTHSGDADGGAVRFNSVGTLRLENSVVENSATTGDNSQGGGIFAGIGSVVLDNSHVLFNRTEGSSSDGGGIFASAVRLYNSSVSRNSTEFTGTTGAAEGGGIFAASFAGIYDQSSVNRNETNSEDANGGGIFTTSAIVRDSVLRDNRTNGQDADGGGVFATGLATVEGSSIYGNGTVGSDSSGGAINAPSVTITDSHVFENYTKGYLSPGGAIQSVVLTARNNLFDFNYTLGNSSSGGALSAYGAALVSNSTLASNFTAGSSAVGGGISAVNLELTNSTVTGNSTGGASATSGGVHSVSSPTVTNSIILGNHSVAGDAEIGSSAASISFFGNNIVGASSTDFNAAAYANAQNATQDPAAPAAPFADHVFDEILPTRFDSDANGTLDSIASGRFSGLIANNGGTIESIALDSVSTNPAIASAETPANLFSFEGNASDSINTGAANTLNGSPSFVPGAVAGISGQAIEFTGNAAEFVQMASPLTIGSTSNTVEVWIKAPVVGSGGLSAGERVGEFLGSFSSSPSANWGILADGQVQIFWNGGQVRLRGTTDLRDGQWHHLAFVRDTIDNEFRAFIDGEVELLNGTGGTSNTAGSNIVFTTAHRIGKDNRGGTPVPFHGAIDELAIHDRALSQEEVRLRAGKFDSRGAGFGRVVAPVGTSLPAVIDIGAFEVRATKEAASLQVTTTLDVVDPFDQLTSLREAIAFANSGDADGVNGPSDTISFASGLSGTITLGGEQLDVTDSLVIEGPTGGDITINADQRSRIIHFSASSGDLTLNRLTLENGQVVQENGGAIRFDSFGDLTLSDTQVSNSSVVGDGLRGGAVYSQRNLLARNSTFDSNYTRGEDSVGGATYAYSTTLENATFANNSTRGFYSHGGAVAGYDVSALNSTFHKNRVFGDESLGGALFSFNAASVGNSLSLGNSASGTSIFSGPRDEIIALQNLTFTGNNLIGESTSAFDASEITEVSNADSAVVFVDGSLSDNGGIVDTIALKPSTTNPALDAGDDSIATSLLFDARGLDRIVDLPGIEGSNQIDLGASEIQSGVNELPGLVVTTTADTNDPTDFETSLREAINYANDLTAGPLADGDLDGNPLTIDTITFLDGEGQPFSGGGTISLALGELKIHDSLIIDASNAEGRVVIDAGGTSRVMHFADLVNSSETFGSLELNNLSLTNGRATGNEVNEADTRFSGGAIRFNSQNTLTLINSSVSNSEVDLAEGGGIFALGPVQLFDSQITGNRVLGVGTGSINGGIGGGGISAGSVSLENSLVESNSSAAHRGRGGGIYGRQSVYVLNSTVHDNELGGIESLGGGIATRGEIILSHATISGNRTTQGGAFGGGLYSENDALIYNSTLSGNYTVGSLAEGGAVSAQNVNLTNSVLLGNVARLAAGDEIGGTGQSSVTTSFFGSNLVGTSNTAFDASVSADVDNANIFQVFHETQDQDSDGVFEGRLTNNGGPTKTIRLKSHLSNPALDSGEDALVFREQINDARGHGRFYDLLGFRNERQNVSDLGATELSEIDDLDILPGDTEVTTDVGDGNPFDGQVALREAVAFSNTAFAGSVITFADDTDDVFASPATIVLSEGQLDVLTSMTVDGTGADRLTIDANGSSRIFDVATAGNEQFTVRGVTLTGGATAGIEGGGAIRVADSNDELVLEGVNVEGNSAHAGGGIEVRNGASFRILNSALVNNQSNFAGAALLALGNTKGAVLNTTVSGNISGNNSGAIQQQSSAAGAYLTLRNATVANNTGSGISSFIYGSGTGTVNVGNSAFAGNSVLGISTSGGTINSAGHNLADDASVGLTAPSDLTGPANDPLLAPLALNGGGVPTHALQPGSPAVEGGDDNLVRSIKKPTSVVSSSAATDHFPATNLVSNSAITLGNFESTSDSTGSWVTSARNGSSGDYFADAADPNPVLTFDLGAQEFLTDIVIWGYSTSAGNDVKDFTLEFSTDGGVTFSEPARFTKPVRTSTDFVHRLPLGEVQSANVVRMTITDNHFTAGQSGGDRVGFNEIRFLHDLKTDQRGVGFDRLVDGNQDGVAVVDVGAFEHRQVFIVDNTSDVDNNDLTPGQLSLREAVRLANTVPGHDDIRFDPNFSPGTNIGLQSQLTPNESVTIQGLGADVLSIDGGDSTRLFELSSPGEATFTFTQIALANGNAGTGAGGAIRIVDSNDTLVLEDVVLAGNRSNGGGAVFVSDADYLVKNSSFVGNNSNFSGSAILTAGEASGLVVNSTFSANVSGSNAGTLFVQTAGTEEATMRVINSTIVGEDAVLPGSNGVGLQAFSSGSSRAVIEVGNSIIADNSHGNAVFGGGQAEIISRGNNISDDGSVAFIPTDDFDLTGENPLLGALSTHGGSTFVYALLPGSPAIDRGNGLLAVDEGGVQLLNDQRDGAFSRVRDGTFDGNSTVDIGAFEFASGAPVVTQIKVSGPSWNPSFLAAIDTNSQGYVLPMGPGQLSDIPFVNAQELFVTFNQPVTGPGGAALRPSDFLLVGSPTLNNTYTIQSVQAIPGTNTVKLSLGETLTRDKLILHIPDDRVFSEDGKLDGEITTAVSTKSGDGRPGGDLNFRFDVLPGNVNDDALTNTTDISLVRSLGTQIAGITPNFEARANVNGDFLVSTTDISAIRALGTQFLFDLADPAEPSGVGNGSSSSSGSGSNSGGGSESDSGSGNLLGIGSGNANGKRDNDSGMSQMLYRGLLPAMGQQEIGPRVPWMEPSDRGVSDLSPLVPDEILDSDRAGENTFLGFRSPRPRPSESEGIAQQSPDSHDSSNSHSEIDAILASDELADFTTSINDSLLDLLLSKRQ